jgi:hypothetical protein
LSWAAASIGIAIRMAISNFFIFAVLVFGCKGTNKSEEWSVKREEFASALSFFNFSVPVLSVVE